ncbi:MAG: ATP-binding protein [Succinivibrionaceae bacterium]
MNDDAQRIKELENEINRLKLEKELLIDRERIVQYQHEQIFSVFQQLSCKQDKDTQYALLISSIKKIIDFEDVVLLSTEDKSKQDFCTIYASLDVLQKHNWKNSGIIKKSIDLNEIFVLSDPSQVDVFQSEEPKFNQIVRSAILVPLDLHESTLLFICTHHIPLILNNISKKEIKKYKPFIVQALISIEYRDLLELAIQTRTHELVDFQNNQCAFRDLSNELYWQTDKNGRFVLDHDFLKFSMNPSGPKKDGVLRYEKLVGKNLKEIFDKDCFKDTEIIKGIIELFENRQKIIAKEFPIYVDGQHLWVRINGQPFYSKNGEYLGYRGTSYNITKEHQQNLEIEKAMNDAEIANRSKTEYLAVMSHEIKTPLQAILGMLDLLEQTNIDDTQRTYIKHVSQSASLLQTILHNVLDLSKIDSQAMVLENISFDIKFCLNSAIIQMREKAENKRIYLNLSISENFPNMVYGDQHRLSQIFFNLINNAIKFTSEGGVTLVAERFQNRLKFSVIDTGTGIPSDKLGHLFHPFAQLDSSISRKYGGTGLGLAICKRLVEHMGGKIGIKSELGKGSTFWFEIPCKVPSTNIIGVKAIHKPIVHKEHNYDILLVEDSQINQFVIKTMLEKLGHNVRLASNGEEAIKQVDAKLPELVFMDLRMPVMDGFEASKHIISKYGRIPIVALSANTSDEERIECRKIGMTSIASKPVTTAILKKILEELEAVIGEVNELVRLGKNIPSNETNNMLVTTGNNENTHDIPLGTISSLNTKSNASLIDALVKNMLGNNKDKNISININKNNKLQRTENTEK